MSLKTFRLAPSFEGVAAGQTATLRLPTGLTYETLLIDYAGVTLAQMTGIRVLANGKEIMNYRSGTELDSDNQYKGRVAAAGIIALDFKRYGLRTRAGEELTSIGTGLPQDLRETITVNGQTVPNPRYNPWPVNTLTLEIDIDAAAAAPVLSCAMVQRAPEPTGAILKVRRLDYAPAAAGDFQISDIPRGDIINMVHFRANNVLNARLEIDNFTAFNLSVARNTFIQTDGVRVPVAGAYRHDPTYDGFGSEGIVTVGVGDMRYTLNMGGAIALPVTVEYIGSLGN